MQNPIQINNKEQSPVLKTKIIKVVEQPIKITDNGKANMLSALGLVLAETVFKPQSGGALQRKILINGVSVVAINAQKGQQDASLPSIYHFLDPRQVRNKRFEVGQKVEVRIEE